MMLSGAHFDLKYDKYHKMINIIKYDSYNVSSVIHYEMNLQVCSCKYLVHGCLGKIVSFKGLSTLAFGVIKCLSTTLNTKLFHQIRIFSKIVGQDLE